MLFCKPYFMSDFPRTLTSLQASLMSSVVRTCFPYFSSSKTIWIKKRQRKTIFGNMHVQHVTLQNCGFLYEMFNTRQSNGLLQDWPKWLFRFIFFPSQSAWIFACAIQFASKTFSCIFFGWNALTCSTLLHSPRTLWYFVLVSLRNKVQTSQKLQENVLLLNWKAHEKIQALLKKNKVTYKVGQSCHQAFNY